MPGIAHETLKYCGTEILSLLRAAEWTHQGKLIELSATGTMCKYIRKMTDTVQTNIDILLCSVHDEAQWQT